ncbi:MAG: hypothetical protein RL026_2712 [Pseudomonadota bacterium]
MVFDGQSRLRALDWQDHEARLLKMLRRHYGPSGSGHTLSAAPPPPQFTAALEAYFAGEHAAIDALTIETGGTAFQREVWAALRQIPAGETLGYGELARRIGRPAAVRATGLAVGANPVSIVVPCHRVIGSDGSLTGYAGGLERKRWLLEHEGAGFKPALPPESRPRP